MDNSLVMLGAPGSGKGTQARILSQLLKIPIFDIGYLLRKKMHECDSSIKTTMSSGNLLSDDFVNNFVRDVLSEVKTHFIIDGFPRTLQQAICLDKLLEKRPLLVIKLMVNEEGLIERLSSRLSCFICGKVYSNTVYKCEKCDVVLNKRNDDTLEIIKHRLIKYKEQEEKLVNFYGDKVISIDGNGQVDEVTEKILLNIGFYT